MVADKDKEVTRSDLEPYKSPEVVLERLRQQKEEQIVKKLKILKFSKPATKAELILTPEQKVDAKTDRGMTPEIETNGILVQDSTPVQQMNGKLNNRASPPQQDDDLKFIDSMI